MSSRKKLNTLTLSGLIIGPILGSGIILLPPLLFNMVGNYSLLIWGIILFFGFIFALVFGKLAILFPGDGGVSIATKNAMGTKYQKLTSLFLIFAVFFGPVAVLLIGVEFIQDYFPDVNYIILFIITYIMTYLLLLTKINFLGNIMLVVTSLITVIFVISSINILINTDTFIFNLPNINIKDIGYSFLLAFWAIVGWEVIGNYSKDVEDTKTLTKSVVFSAAVVSLVYILVALAISFGEFNNTVNEEFKLLWIIEPIFKGYSQLLLSTVTIILCIGTLVLFVGGVARLISSLHFTKYTSTHISSGAPKGALDFLAMVHMIVLYLVYKNILDISSLVAFADGFFISNAIIGLITAIVIFENGFFKYSSYLLIVLFSIILLFSNLFILAIILGLFLFVYFKKS